jgi:hypothetical protein
MSLPMKPTLPVMLFGLRSNDLKTNSLRRQQTALVLLDAFDRLVRAERHFQSPRGRTGILQCRIVRPKCWRTGYEIHGGL